MKDVFSASEYAFARPVYGKETFKKFQKANGWIKDFMPNYQVDETEGMKILGDSWVVGAVRDFGEVI